MNLNKIFMNIYLRIRNLDNNMFRDLIFKIYSDLIYLHHFILNSKYFYIDGKKYTYFSSPYYQTLATERCIEIPFVLSFINNNSKTNTLEIGNVLSNHISFKHDVLDKYEIAKGVINEDVAYYNFKKKYDLILSISTLEHVGFDEPEHDAEKVIIAIKNLINSLDKKGILIISVPLGYNPVIDKLILRNTFKFKKYFMIKTSFMNTWKQANISEAMNKKYGSKYPFANSIAFLLYYK